MDSYKNLAELQNKNLLDILKESINLDIPESIQIDWDFKVVDLEMNWKDSNGAIDNSKIQIKELNNIFINKNLDSEFKTIPLSFNHSRLLPKNKIIDSDNLDDLILCQNQILILQLKNYELLPDKNYIIEMDIESLNDKENSLVNYDHTLFISNGNKKIDFNKVSDPITDNNPIPKLTSTIPSSDYNIENVIYDYLENLTFISKPVFLTKTDGMSKIIELSFNKNNTLIIGNIGNYIADKNFNTLDKVLKFNKLNIYPISSNLSKDVPEKLLKLKISEKIKSILNNI